MTATPTTDDLGRAAHDVAERVREASRERTGAAGTGAAVGADVGAVLGTAAERLAARSSDLASATSATAGEAAERLAARYDAARAQFSGTDAGALARSWQAALESAFQDGRERAADLLAVTPRRSRRWPWAVAAAVAGAAAGAAVALLLQRLAGQDAPGAQEPEQLRAVVDPAPVDPADPAGPATTRPGQA